VEGAGALHGRLLIAHGMMDDNVHAANTAQFILKLQDERKQFDLMLYPSDRHGFGRGGRHFRELLLRYILEHL
jgi:dipeptidyl-peptidase-4